MVSLIVNSQLHCSNVFIVNFEHISHLFLAFLLLTLNMKMLTGLYLSKIHVKSDQDLIITKKDYQPYNESERFHSIWLPQTFSFRENTAQQYRSNQCFSVTAVKLRDLYDTTQSSIVISWNLYLKLTTEKKTFTGELANVFKDVL